MKIQVNPIERNHYTTTTEDKTHIGVKRKVKMQRMKDPIQLFNKSWGVYKKVVDADYMSHKLFFRLTNDAIKEHASQKDLSILDLGCGDAAGLKNILQHINCIEYAGYDLSNTAISLAKKNLDCLGPKVRFVEGKMEENIKLEKSKFDVVHS